MAATTDLSQRLLKFAARIGVLVERLPDSRLGRHIAAQLVRCGTSPLPNYAEAQQRKVARISSTSYAFA